MRLKSSPRMAPSVFAVSVFASPGLPSMSTCPWHRSPRTIVSLRSCSPTMTLFSSSIRADSQASGLDRWRSCAADFGVETFRSGTTFRDVPSVSASPPGGDPFRRTLPPAMTRQLLPHGLTPRLSREPRCGRLDERAPLTPGHLAPRLDAVPQHPHTQQDDEEPAGPSCEPPTSPTPPDMRSRGARGRSADTAAV